MSRDVGGLLIQAGVGLAFLLVGVAVAANFRGITRLNADLSVGVFAPVARRFFRGTDEEWVERDNKRVRWATVHQRFGGAIFAVAGTVALVLALVGLM